jgi:hypothetical protein
MRLVGPDDGMNSTEIAGRIYDRHKDGTFHVDDPNRAELLRSTGDFTHVGTTLTGTVGYRCGDCGFLAVFRDRCGRCGGTDLLAE